MAEILPQQPDLSQRITEIGIHGFVAVRSRLSTPGLKDCLGKAYAMVYAGQQGDRHLFYDSVDSLCAFPASALEVTEQAVIVNALGVSDSMYGLTSKYKVNNG